MEESAEIRDEADFAMSSEIIGRLVPFHILVDMCGIIRSAGPAMLKLVGAKQLIDHPVYEVLHFIKPRHLDPAKNLQDGLGKRLSVDFQRIDESLDSKAFGMAFAIDYAGAPHVFIALTPSVNARAFVERHGLKISDFGPADGSADLLPLLAMQEDMLEDSKKKSARLAAARDAAERLANHDALTELPNRRALMDRLSKTLVRSDISLLHLDLDRFKEINDTYGHAAGDAALKHTAESLREVLGQETLCARLGGDEFVGLVEGMKSEEELDALARKLVAQISETFRFEGDTLKVGASVGIATATPSDQLSADVILHHADIALYEAKRVGRGGAFLCTPELLQAQVRFQNLSADIRRGLGQKEFVAYLQPQIEARTGAIVGGEALVRWNHPGLGLLEPSQFLEEADRAGLLQQIDTEVRSSALDTLKLGDVLGTSVPKICLNVTTADLTNPKFGEFLCWELDSRGLDTSRVVIEIVETVFFDENSRQIIEACQALVLDGFTLSLDDFGTGHASALSLVHLPLSVVKIDRAFAAALKSNDRRQAMARSLVGMATMLGLDVIAEGVEDESDIELLQEMGCEHFQSFYLGCPMPQNEFFGWMSHRLNEDIPRQHAEG
ncbi:bifunctional diguanylate cyclase/phosphodiesterase [uncultured Roseobacter sp.]|uniref:putative bifunctional diguanylate cyclase/phosphodiesterase n=1 Tax=uncultured Roseobacter sp. TaxID=114847 RepID=UPI002619260F|nr:bifunctional diguanylate cyclase/phosphodiesterase [uncultured Roseobacter sp.]